MERARVRSGLSGHGVTMVAAGVTVVVAVGMGTSGTAFAGAGHGDRVTGVGPIQPGASGVVSAHGAAVSVPFTFTCPVDYRANVSLSLVQAGAEGFASGYGYKGAACTGARQQVQLYVQANTQTGAQPFRAGPASVVASLDAYDPAQQECGDGGPCPAATAAPAEPAAAPDGATQPGVGGKTRTFASTVPGAAGTPYRATGYGPGTEDDHSEFQGTITLR